MKRLLWFDACAGAVAGLLLMAGAGLLEELLGLDRVLVRAMAAVNLCYSLYSTSLARQAAPPTRHIWALIVANASWTVVCAVLALLHLGETPLGAAYLAGEGLFVGVLAAVEARALRRVLYEGGAIDGGFVLDDHAAR